MVVTQDIREYRPDTILNFLCGSFSLIEEDAERYGFQRLLSDGFSTNMRQLFLVRRNLVSLKKIFLVLFHKMQSVLDTLKCLCTFFYTDVLLPRDSVQRSGFHIVSDHRHVEDVTEDKTAPIRPDTASLVVQGLSEGTECGSALVGQTSESPESAQHQKKSSPGSVVEQPDDGAAGTTAKGSADSFIKHDATDTYTRESRAGERRGAVPSLPDTASNRMFSHGARYRAVSDGYQRARGVVQILHVLRDVAKALCCPSSAVYLGRKNFGEM